MDAVKLKDSGKRQEFDTGSVRDTREGKGRYDLLPPHAIYLVARQFEEGALKYGVDNWLKGQPLSRYVDSALRHLFKHMGGETDERHDVAAAWNILALLETRHLIEKGELPKELNDIRRERETISEGH
mgnify:CR=1 FL=1|tara:strand:+ start:425 stop:808 length:384 start_codon:yes stop_codon:yes gene_type:complete